MCNRTRCPAAKTALSLSSLSPCCSQVTLHFFSSSSFHPPSLSFKVKVVSTTLQAVIGSLGENSVLYRAEQVCVHFHLGYIYGTIHMHCLYNMNTRRDTEHLPPAQTLSVQVGVFLHWCPTTSLKCTMWPNVCGLEFCFHREGESSLLSRCTRVGFCAFKHWICTFHIFGVGIGIKTISHTPSSMHQ